MWFSSLKSPTICCLQAQEPEKLVVQFSPNPKVRESGVQEGVQRCKSQSECEGLRIRNTTIWGQEKMDVSIQVDRYLPSLQFLF